MIIYSSRYKTDMEAVKMMLERMKDILCYSKCSVTKSWPLFA